MELNKNIQIDQTIKKRKNSKRKGVLKRVYTEDEKKQQKAQIASSIKRFRAANGLSQQSLANKLGISNMQIMRWENGRTMPNLLAIKALKDLGILT